MLIQESDISFGNVFMIVCLLEVPLRGVELILTLAVLFAFFLKSLLSMFFESVLVLPTSRNLLVFLILLLILSTFPFMIGFILTVLQWCLIHP